MYFSLQMHAKPKLAHRLQASKTRRNLTSHSTNSGKMVPGKNGPWKNSPGKLRNKKSRGERRASWCVCARARARVCGMFGCDQSMKTQNSTTNIPGLL